MPFHAWIMTTFRIFLPYVFLLLLKYEKQYLNFFVLRRFLGVHLCRLYAFLFLTEDILY